MAPEKRLALASVTMKLLTPGAHDDEAVEPAEQRRRAPARARTGDRHRQAEHLHEIAGQPSRRRRRSSRPRDSYRRSPARPSAQKPIDDVDREATGRGEEVEARRRTPAPQGEDENPAAPMSTARPSCGAIAETRRRGGAGSGVLDGVSTIYVGRNRRSRERTRCDGREGPAEQAASAAPNAARAYLQVR